MPLCQWTSDDCLKLRPLFQAPDPNTQRLISIFTWVWYMSSKLNTSALNSWSFLQISVPSSIPLIHKLPFYLIQATTVSCWKCQSYHISLNQPSSHWILTSQVFRKSVDLSPLHHTIQARTALALQASALLTDGNTCTGTLSSYDRASPLR